MLIFIFSLVCDVLVAQENEVAKNYGSQIAAPDVKEYLSILASDALEGRKTGTRGQKMAAAFIADHFREIGLIPPVNEGYEQPVELYSAVVTEAHVSAGTERYDNFGEIFYFGSMDTGGEVQSDIVFGGKGTEDDYKQVDVKDKAVLLLASGISSLRMLSLTARGKGAKMIYVVSDGSPEEFHTLTDRMKGFVASGNLNLKKPDPTSLNKGIFLVSQPAAQKLLNIPFDQLKKAAEDPKKNSLKKIKPGKISYQVEVHLTTIKTENVLGYLEGTDKKDELVLVTAHYDHIGTTTSGDDHVNNGADDDGSGTVSVLDLARIFAKAKKEGHGPRRSILFMTFVGEEQGLLGSEYYVEHPVYPLAGTVVDLNIDMIGRTDAEHKGNSNYVYVIGSDKLSSELHQLSERINNEYTKLTFDYTYNDENHPSNLYRRSDHWNFAKNGIPIIFYFDGIHEDYHQPSDEVSKIDFDLLAKRAQCVFYTAWEIANRDARIIVDRK